MTAPAAAAATLFSKLKAGCAADWSEFVDHPFVQQLGDGSLPEACFRHYLVQDYLFLMHFSRAYALAVYKSEHLDDMRQAAATLDALLNHEMSLHIRSCAAWGLSEADLTAVPETPQNMAYTRYVLERGLAGDLLDLLVALAPCVVGYGEIAVRLQAAQGPKQGGNLYRDWIETYSGTEYQEVVKNSLAQLDRVADRRLGRAPETSERWDSLQRGFRAATRLEIGFWDMGLNPPS